MINALRVLVVAPHPDDETLGCGGTIAWLRQKGVRVEVLVVTNGAASHRNSASYPKARLVAVRQRETIQALMVLGVKRNRITFARLSDGAYKIWSQQRSAMLRVRSKLAQRWDAVFTPSDFDEHPDHRATSLLVQAINRAPVVYAYTIWPAAKRRGKPLISQPLKDLRARKRLAIKQHRTQLGAITDDPEGFCLGQPELNRLLRPAEKFERLS